MQPYGLGANEILVELPGISDPRKVEDAIKSTSKLAVYAVVSGPYENDQAAMTALNSVVPPDDMLVHGNATPTAPDEVFLLKRASQVEGTDFRDAQPSTDENGRPNMRFTLTTEAGDRFYQVHLGPLEGQRVAGIDGDRAWRQGQGSCRDQLGASAIRARLRAASRKDEVENLSLMLRTGALPASIHSLDTRDGWAEPGRGRRSSRA